MKLYNDYSSYLKKRFGQKVYRIGLDAGFTCPNRDGTKGRGPCAYCPEDGARSSYTNPEEPVSKQLEKRIDYLKKTRDAMAFVAYFQAFTNTYASPDSLKKIYDAVLDFKEIVGISIGTRPDTIDRDKLKLISSYGKRYDLWMEYGLQSAHDRTLKDINRGHTFADFVEAVRITEEFGIPVCAHVIIGLPRETKEDMIETAKRLASLKVSGAKIHLLHILKGSALEKQFLEGKVKILEQDEYVEYVCDFLEHLPPEIIIQRLTGEGTKQNHVAPAWAFDKIGTINKIDEELKRRGSYQGKMLYASPVL